MTNRECIEHLKRQLANEQRVENRCLELVIQDDVYRGAVLEQEILIKSIQALEFKEKYEPLITPKKPIIITDWPFKNDEVCPNCKEGNIRYPDVGWMYKHCPDCGQALNGGKDE